MMNKYKVFNKLSELSSSEIKKIVEDNLQDNQLLSYVLKEYELFTPVTVRLGEHDLYGRFYGILLIPNEISNMKIYRCHDYVGHAYVKGNDDE